MLIKKSILYYTTITMPIFYIKIIDNKAKEYYRHHSTFHEGDSGIDLFVVRDTVVQPGETVFLKLGIQTEAFCTKQKKNVSYWLLPRSSISKTPLRMSNSVGLIDAGYRGELMAAVDHVKFNQTEPYLIRAGTRLFQLCAGDLSTDISMKCVAGLSETTRGEGAYGSTGK